MKNVGKFKKKTLETPFYRKTKTFINAYYNYGYCYYLSCIRQSSIVGSAVWCGTVAEVKFR